MILRLLFAAVAGIALPSPLQAEDILLGASVQLTESTANTGRYYRDGYEFAIDKINAAGGVQVGKARQKLNLKLYDNQSDVNLSVQQYVQLVSADKVNFLLGPFASNFAARGLRDLTICVKSRDELPVYARELVEHLRDQRSGGQASAIRKRDSNL